MEDMEDDDIHYFGSRFAPSESHCPSASSSCVVGVVVVVVVGSPFTHDDSSQAPNENAQRAVLASCAGPVRGRQPSFVFSSSSPCCPCPSKNNLVLVLPRDASWLDHMRSMPNAGYRSATNERLMRAESCATATSRWHAAPSGALLRGGIPGNEGPRAMRAQVNNVRKVWSEASTPSTSQPPTS